MISFKNGPIFIDGKWERGLELRVKEGRIVDIVPEDYRSDQDTEIRQVIDAGGKYIVPGFIDIHIHGANGSDIMDASKESLENISSYLAKNGTTSYLATTMTCSIEDIKKAMGAVAQYMKGYRGQGAQILGLHMEGPFISPKARGAHDKDYIKDPSIDLYKELVGDLGSIVKVVTLAPELEGAVELASYLNENNTRASMGHTKATYDIAKEAIGKGINHVCHFYNAMQAFSHREPGVVGAVLDSGDSTIELIADLVHIHPAALRLAVSIKGKDRCALITDAMSAAGLGDGTYMLGGLEVYVEKGQARQIDGTLAGSTLNQAQALRNMVKIGLGLEDVLTMLTKTPARIIGVDGYKGQLKEGYDADILLLDRDLNVAESFVRGQRQA